MSTFKRKPQASPLNDKGWYATEAALNTQIPTGQEGWYAIVGETDTFFIWDDDTTAWVNSSGGGGGSSSSLVSGETINGETLPVPVLLPSGTPGEESIASQLSAQGNDTIMQGTNWGAQTFLMDSSNRITKVLVRLQKVGSPAGNVDVSIYAVDGSNKPTGAALGTKSILASTLTLSYANYEFVFDTPVTVSPTTTYAIVISAPSGDGSNRVEWDYRVTSPYPNGGKTTSSDSGSSWGAVSATDDQYFEVSGYFLLTPDRVYACDGDDNAKLRFIGFAISNAIEDGSIDVQFEGIVSGFSGLSIGDKYYVQDSVGTIGTTVGTNEIAVGIAISATELLIVKEEQYIGTDLLSESEAAADAVGTLTIPSGTKTIIIQADYSSNNGVSAQPNKGNLAVKVRSALPVEIKDFYANLSTSWHEIIATVAGTTLTVTVTRQSGTATLSGNVYYYG